jgi:hypothetical protein
MKPFILFGAMSSSPPPVIASVSVTSDAPMVNVPNVASASATGYTSLAYQWKRDGAAIGGATSATYSPVAADVGTSLSVTATATGPGGSVSSTHTCTTAVVSDLTLLYVKTSGMVSGIAPATDADDLGNTLAALDTSTNRYIWEYTGAAWTSGAISASGSIRTQAGNGADDFMLRPESGTMQLYVSDNYNSTTWVAYGAGSYNLFTPVAATQYTLAIEGGFGSALLVKDSTPIYKVGSRGATNAYKRSARTTARPDPAGINWINWSSGVSATALRIYRREKASIRHIVLLGDSITAAPDWSGSLAAALGRNWLVDGCGVGYRQSRELVTAISTPFAGDAYNPPNYYSDASSSYLSGALENWALIGIGTNDLIHYNAAVVNPGPESGGYTVTNAGGTTDTVTNILSAITQLQALGYKVAVRTMLNCSVASSGGTYATVEAMRQTLNAAILTGVIAAAADRVIDQDNVFAPAASRTDGAVVDGPCYDAAHWPKYSQNNTYFNPGLDGGIHPRTAGYEALATYDAAQMLA